jgi:hypothetical protein
LHRIIALRDIGLDLDDIRQILTQDISDLTTLLHASTVSATAERRSVTAAPGLGRGRAAVGR